MNNPTKLPVDELLSEDKPEAYAATLSAFYEAWISSEHSSGVSPEDRHRTLLHFKSMRKFFFRISKKNEDITDKEYIWIS